MDRLRHEQEFHDRQAQLRALTFTQDPSRLLVHDDRYFDHESWLRPAFSALGEVRGLDVLDLGCGHGMASVLFSRRGARVIACDLSVGYLAEARRRAQANGVTFHCCQADAQRLPFADSSFDRIWGHAILHHLDLTAAVREVHRVLRPGGMAVFCEPWGENPLLNLLRRRFHLDGKQHTADERPLRTSDLQIVRRFFPDLEVRGFELFSSLRAIRLVRPMLRLFQRWDSLILARSPAARRLCRYVVLVVRRRAL